MEVIQHVSSAIKRAYHNITFSKRSTFWFIVISVHCILQTSFQALTFVDNSAAKNVVGVCIQESVLTPGISVIIGDTLQKCNGVPGQSSTSCSVVSQASTKGPHQFARDDDADEDGDGIFNHIPPVFQFTLPDGTELSLSAQCIDSLSWLEETFRDAKSEDVVTLCFQFWLFGISLLAILNNSIPHLVVTVASHFLDTAWAAFRIKGTTNLRSAYVQFVVEGACDGTDILGSWWDVRMSHAVPIVACNAVVLFIVLYSAWLLSKSFIKQTFSSVGASPVINRAYKLVLCFEASLELATFFALGSSAIWINRVTTGSIKLFAHHAQWYEAAFAVIASIIPLLIISGWLSIRRELNWLYIVFALLQTLVIVIWVVTFASVLYRFEVNTWSFFACTSITAFVFIVATTVTSIMCRLNFGKGLAHFLKVQATLGSSGFTPEYFTNDPTTVTEPWSELDSEKRDEDWADEKANQLSFPEPIPPHKMRSTFKQLTSAVFRQDAKKSTDFVPRRFSLVAQPKFKLPIEAPPSAFLSLPRKQTPSMLTSSSAGSTGVVSYASRSALSSATARTLQVSRV